VGAGADAVAGADTGADATSADASNTTATVTFGYSGYTVIHRNDEKELPTEALVEGTSLLP
jgi:hypothetical protein